MDKLIEYILQFGNLNSQQIMLVTNNAKEVMLDRNSYFSEAGKIPMQV